MLTTVPFDPTVAVRSATFDAAKTVQSVLCLEVGRDRFRFLVQDHRRRGCYLEDYLFPSMLADRPLVERLPDVFRHHPVLSAGPWQQIRISVNSPSFTLIPKTLYRKEYAGSYLSLMRGSALPAHEFAQAYSHESEEFLSVFDLSHPLADYFSGAYPLQPITFVHQTSALIQATANLSRHTLTAQTIYLYFDDEFVTIISRQAGQLRYCNRFGYKTTQDLAYYVLYVLNELHLSIDTTSVWLFGEITPFADAYTELNRFLPNLSFGHTPRELTLTNEFDDLPDHRYLNLYGLLLLND